MKPYGYVYLIINRVNLKCYVGQSIDAFSRLYSHYQLGLKDGESHFLYDEMKLFGMSSFSFTILDTANSKEELDSKETLWAIQFQASFKEGGYCKRIRPGWSGPKSSSTRKKMSLAKKGKPQTPEHIKNAAKKRGGPNDPRKGRKTKPRDSKTRSKISLTMKGNGWKRLCSVCKEKGHRKTNCPFAENKSSNRSPHTQATRDKLSLSVRNSISHCSVCGKVGHKKPKCPLIPK